MAASLDWQTYSSARGTVLEMIQPGSDGVADMPGMMIFMDPPHHDELRRLVSRAFTPRRVAALEQRVRELCAQFLEPHLEGAGFDFLEDYAAKIPAMVIGALLGVPVDAQDQFRMWADLMMRYEPEGASPEKLEAMANLDRYTVELVRDRARQPQDDMISDLLAAELTREDGSHRRLSEREVMAFFTLLEIAGSETTARLLGWMAVLLARHPSQRAALAADPTLIPNAIEELLRYEAPSPIQARYVTREVNWHGTTVPAGSKLAMLTGSAGRDEREFPEPDRFDVTRKFERHITFGHGIHFCIGANLARLEGAIVLEETLRRMPAWDVDEAKVEMVRTSTVRGPIRVPVHL
jgi:cytochrome P450